MTERRSGFLSGYAGNTAQKIARWGVQKFLPGNQMQADGTLNNSAVWKGGLAAGARVGAGLMFGPAGAAVAGNLGGRVVDNRWGPTEGGVFDRVRDQFAPGQNGAMPVERQQLDRPSYGLNIRDIQTQPGTNLGFGGQSFSQPAMTQQPMAAPGGFAGGVFNGGAGNFGAPAAPPSSYWAGQGNAMTPYGASVVGGVAARGMFTDMKDAGAGKARFGPKQD